MSTRIARPETAFPDNVPSKNAKPVKNKAYLDFIRGLPCLIAHAGPVEAAHLSTASIEHGHMGRGKGQKASDRWALPLCTTMHRVQHTMSEMKFWNSHNIDPHAAANALWGAYQEQGEKCHDWAVKMILSDAWRCE